MKLKLVKHDGAYYLSHTNNSVVSLKNLLKQNDTQLDISYSNNISKEEARDNLCYAISSNNNKRERDTLTAKLSTIVTGALVTIDPIIHTPLLDTVQIFNIDGHSLGGVSLGLFSLALSNFLIKRRFNKSLDKISRNIARNEEFIFKDSIFKINLSYESSENKTESDLYNSFSKDQGLWDNQEQYQYQEPQSQDYQNQNISNTYTQGTQNSYQQPTDLESKIAQLRSEIQELESN